MRYAVSSHPDVRDVRNTAERIRVLLLDDHPAVVDGLAGYLEHQPGIEVVARCTTVDSALASLQKVQPDVAIVDVKVGGGFTFELVTKARASLPDLKLIFITGHDDDVFMEKAFKVGAQGFVLKSEPLADIAQAVREVASGQRYVSKEARRRFGDSPASSRLALLTPREREVLLYVSQGKSAKEISRVLDISTWTVTNHKANIMAKLDIHNQVGLARFALATGLATDLR
jgi:DNA-binding NarL/FixJ family response regulator